MKSKLILTEHFYIYSRVSCNRIYVCPPLWFIRCYDLTFNGKETEMDRVSITV